MSTYCHAELCQYVAYNMAMHVCQSKVPSGIAICQTLMIQPHQVQDRGVQIVNVHSIFLVAGTRGKSRLSELDPKQLELSMQSNGRARPLPFELPGAAVSRNADTAVIGRLVRTTTSAFDSLRTGSRSWGFQPLALEVRRWNPPAGATTAQDLSLIHI